MGVIDILNDRLDDEALAQIILKGMENPLDKFKYISKVLDMRLTAQGSDKDIQITINGMEEIRIDDWNKEVDTYNTITVGKDKWDYAVKRMSMISEEQRKFLLELNPAIITSLVTEIDQIRKENIDNDNARNTESVGELSDESTIIGVSDPNGDASI